MAETLTDAVLRLLGHAQTPATVNGYVLVPKGDLEALAAILDAPRLAQLYPHAFTPWHPEVSP